MSETAVVTLLFCDLVSSTELLTALGDDANDEVRRALSSALERVVGEHRGTVVKSIGDGMMVSFRTSAADAVACAAAMQRAAAAVERTGARIGLELRVGISSGEASHEGDDWFGTPVVEAARLEAAASAGQILVSEVVRALVGTRGGAKFRSAGTRQFKGFDRPVPVVEVVWRDASTPPKVKRKKKRPSWRRTLVAGAALVLVAGAAVAAGLVFMPGDSGGDDKAAVIPAATLVAEGYTPVLEPRDCPAELTSDPAVRCHDLVVPEDRSKPAGRQIRILVMVAPSNAEPAGVPTVFIGEAYGTLYANLDPGVLGQPAGSDVRDYGDVVAFGVRGRRFSQPMLACPEVSGLQRELLALPDNGPEANELWLEAAEQCGRRLAGEGVDLNAYGQDEIVDDLRDLAIAKGWHQINVQGSYDLSRTAVLLAARYPGLVRSVVLAAPFPVDATWYEDRLSNFDSAFQAYYAACRADPACEQAFPNLEQAVPAIYAQFQQDPVVVPAADPAGGPDISVLINGDRFADITALGRNAQDLLPSSAAQWVTADQESGSRALAAYVVLASAVDVSYGGDADPWGANFSAYCEDVDQHVVRGDLAAAESLYPLLRVYAHDPLFDLCARWPAQARSRAIGPLETASAVPALIFTGALDPFAPPAYAQRAANAFTHATVAVFPDLASDVLTVGPPCISALRLEFLRDPTAELDIDGCIEQVPAIAFEGTGTSGTIPAGPTGAP
ncbi:MAG: adenylate/guanylate cyclase domain-containing protein [Dehalococcoidia bacterium]